MSHTTPTPYPEVNLVLGELLASVQSILGEHFVGMYLHGSLATGGFDRDSDVDYIVVTDEEVPVGQFAALEEMHTRIKTMDAWCATQLEGSYIPLHALQKYDPQRALFVHIDRGPEHHLEKIFLGNERLSRGWWGGWILLRSALREHGITLLGPDPKTLIDPIPPADVQQANLSFLDGWTMGILDNPARVKTRGYQSYIVLTLCRILFTLHTGGIASKPEAIRWARKTLDEKWTPLIDLAWLGRQNPGLEAGPDDVDRTLEFIRYTIEQSQQIKITAGNCEN